MRHLRSFLAPVAIAAFTAGTALSPAAVAQSTTPTQPGKQNPANYSDEEVKAFAVASLELRQISQRYAPKMKAAASPDQKRQVQQEAVKEMSKAVRDSGLSVNRFNAISASARQDPKLASKIRQEMRQAQ